MARRLATFAGRISYGIKLQRPPVARWAHKSKGKHLDNQSVTQPTNEVNENLTPNEPFPLEVFPETIRAFVEAVARSIGCPIDFVAVAVLVACACSIGAARVLKIKEGWLEFSNLYVAIVGEQGSGKSPAMEAALYRRRNGERAVPIHLTTDATMEALVLALRENVRHGVLYVADSLVGLFQALNKYRNGKGNDREFLEVLWGGSEATTWRTMQDSGRRQLELRAWLRQFDDDNRIEMAFLLLKRLAGRGYVSAGAREYALGKLVDGVAAHCRQVGSGTWNIIRNRHDNLCLSYVDSELKSGGTCS